MTLQNIKESIEKYEDIAPADRSETSRHDIQSWDLLLVMPKNVQEKVVKEQGQEFSR